MSYGSAAGQLSMMRALTRLHAESVRLREAISLLRNAIWQPQWDELVRAALSLMTPCAMIASIASAQMMDGLKPPVPMTPDQFSRAASGDSVQIAVRVESVMRRIVSARSYFSTRRRPL